MTYVTVLSSFMITQCVATLSQQNSDKYNRAVNTILRNFYMNDLMTGGERQEEFIQLYREITSILDSEK